MKSLVIRADATDPFPLADGCVQTVITSPPYWGLRDYGIDGQLGLERTPDEYVEKMVGVFREVWRVLRDDGTVWLNMGDSYAAGGYSGGMNSLQTPASITRQNGWRSSPRGLKTKDLVGMPWRLAFALQADGWYLRSDIVWNKPNPMPESVTDRPTKAHEYVFLLTKSARYYYDADAVRTPAINAGRVVVYNGTQKNTGHENSRYPGADGKSRRVADGRNLRSVWLIATNPFPEVHFATFPIALVRPCILAGSRPDDLVLDPFAGSGTVGVVARQYGRRFVGLELSPTYATMAQRRIQQEGRPKETRPLRDLNAHQTGLFE